MSNKTIQLSLQKYKNEKNQLYLKDIPCFCCPDNIACFQPQNCAKLSKWIGAPNEYDKAEKE